MTTLIKKNSLLDRALTLNRMLEKSYIELAVTLVEIVETEAYKEGGYEDFTSYYRDELCREKTTVSRLLTVGRWLKDTKLSGDGASYAKLDAAIKAFPDKGPDYILAAAKTNTLQELQQENRERVNGVCSEHEPITICGKCKVRIHG